MRGRNERQECVCEGAATSSRCVHEADAWTHPGTRRLTIQPLLRLAWSPLRPLFTSLHTFPVGGQGYLHSGGVGGYICGFRLHPPNICIFLTQPISEILLSDDFVELNSCL